MSAQSNPGALPPALLREANQALASWLGCLMPEDRMGALSRALGRAAFRLGVSDAALCRRLIDGDVNDRVMEELAAELLPGETYFFRDQPCMNAMQQDLLPRLLQERRGERTLNIWSAACSTGEEPLSLAMLLHASLGRLDGWSIRILATDLRGRALDAARRGSYREWSFRDCPGWIRERFFTPQGPGIWAVAPEILALVDYRRFNLVRDAFPPPNHPAGGFDLVLCRNVLIYLDPRRIPPLLEQLCDCLAEGGWLLVSAVEAPSVGLERVERVRLGETLFFRKRRMAPPPRENSAPVPDALHAEPAMPLAGQSQTIAWRRESAAPCEPESAEKRIIAPEAQGVGRRDAEQYLAQAASRLDEGDLAAARSLVRRALYLDRRNVHAHLLQGRLHQAEGQGARARRAYQAALKLLERLAPGQALDHDRQLTAAELAVMLREMLSRLSDR